MVGQVPRGHTLETADWLSAVGREYKRPNATAMSSIGLGGLGRQTNKPKLIEDNSKPNSFPVPVSQFPSFTVPSFTVQFSQPPVSQSQFHSPQFHSPVSQSSFPVPVSQSTVSQSPVSQFPVFLSFVGTMTHGSVSL